MPDIHDRAELAFRTALAHDDLPPAPSLQTVRRRARQQKVGSVVAIGFFVLAVLTGAVAVSVHGVRPSVAGGVAGQLPADPAPAGWRTDYYRDISFQVPASWGYVYQPAAEQCRSLGRVSDQPYVAQVSSPADGTLDCVDTSPSHDVDHVRVVPRDEYDGNNTDDRSDGWWTLHRISLETDLSVTTTDEALARRIVASIQQNPTVTPCPPHSSLEQRPDSRPTPFDLSRLRPRSITGLAVCQYDSPAGGSSGLRASRQLPAIEARAAVAAMLGGPTDVPAACQARLDGFTALVRIEAAGNIYTVNLAAGCMIRPSQGTLDDGTTRRVVTRTACQALVALPIGVPPSAGPMAQTCNG